MVEWWVLAGFHLFLVAMLGLDLGLFDRQKAQRVTLKRAAVWSLIWIGLALVFALGLKYSWPAWHPDAPEQGTEKATEFVTGYLVELSLSVDNLFVFLVIFRYFGVPEALRHRVLAWGILGAVLLRATFIVAGTELLLLFRWMIYVLAGFLLFTGYKLLGSLEEEIDPGRNWLLRLARRWLPVVDNYDSPRFWVRRAGRWHATPLPLVLLVIESTDVLFAVDSIPAVFGISRDPFIVYTSNIFAVIGLRSFYFLLANFLGMFRYLKVGLAVVLILVGIKMILEEWWAPRELFGLEKKDTILITLGTIAAVLGIAVATSLLRGGRTLKS